MGDFDLKSRITNYTDLESVVTRSLMLSSSAADKNVDLSSYCETTLELKSRIETDFYGDLQETTQPFKVVDKIPAPPPSTQIKPPSSVR